MYMSRLMCHTEQLGYRRICYVHISKTVHTYIHLYIQYRFVSLLEVPKVNLLIKALIPILRLIIRYKEKRRQD